MADSNKQEDLSDSNVCGNDPSLHGSIGSEMSERSHSTVAEGELPRHYQREKTAGASIDQAEAFHLLQRGAELNDDQCMYTYPKPPKVPSPVLASGTATLNTNIAHSPLGGVPTSGFTQNYDVSQNVAQLRDPLMQLQGNLTSQANVSVPSSMGDPNFKQIMTQISECKVVDDFVFAYLDPLYEACLQRITKDQQQYSHSNPGQLRTDWAKDWAGRLKNQDPVAKSLNADRKVCLELLYAMCNRWRPKDPASTPTVSEADIVNVFKDTRVKRILYCCLVMDRANALYNMIDAKTNLRGMHWYSHKDMEIVRAWRAWYGEDRANDPTINKRLTWLFEIEGLGLWKEDFLQGLMEPCRESWHSLPSTQQLKFAANYQSEAVK